MRRENCPKSKAANSSDFYSRVIVLSFFIDENNELFTNYKIQILLQLAPYP
jgi:hypothetical protein